MKKREEEEEHDNLNLSSSKNNSSFFEQNSNVSGIGKSKTAKKGKKQLKPLVKKKSITKTDTKYRKRRKSASRKYSSSSISEQNIKIPKDLNNLRPPTVWNFPIHKIEKIFIDGNKKEIRNVDPTLCYKDGRVDKFLKLFEEIYQNTLNYFLTSSIDLWDYFYSKCLKALRITYTTNKELKAEEELKRQIEEELKRQEEEELKKEEEREKELERLKIRKKGEGDIQQPVEDNKENNKIDNKNEIKNEIKTENKNIKRRISSAKPSKEVGKKRATNRVQTAKKSNK